MKKLLLISAITIFAFNANSQTTVEEFKIASCFIRIHQENRWRENYFIKNVVRFGIDENNWDLQALHRINGELAAYFVLLPMLERNHPLRNHHCPIRNIPTPEFNRSETQAFAIPLQNSCPWVMIKFFYQLKFKTTAEEKKAIIQVLSKILPQE